MSIHLQRYKKQRGVTLVELMISSTVGLLLTAAVGTLFIQNKQSYNQNEHVSFIQDNGKFALTTLTNDISAADFWGGVSDLSKIDASAADLPFAAGEECVPAGTSYDVTTSLFFLNQPSAADAAAAFPCIDSFDAGTSMLLIKRVRGLEADALTTNSIYLRVADLQNAAFFAQDAAETARAANETDWEYFLHVYYIDNNLLKRKTINNNPSTNPPTMMEETLAEGIERFHLEFGIDTSSDNTADFFTSTPTPAQFNDAVVARVHILARADDILAGYTNNKSYLLGDLAIPANNDGYLRRSYTASTPIRNVANLR